MKIAFVIYDNVTLLDFAGAYDPLTRLKTMGFMPDLTYDICARKECIRSAEGAELSADRVGCDLSSYDYVIIPGGEGIQQLMKDPAFLRWISVASEKTTVAAVCGGSLLLGAAGLLRTRKATTHPRLMNILENFVGDVSTDRIVDEGNIITAGGVTAAIDLGLYLCEKIAGAEVRGKIQVQMDYRCYRIV
ncbi:MAG: DJ-1/PfpI family protein [Methanoregula sp.]|jgi:cyclohexyl-isocyanide hydratase|uniref:DJ-1/PfpI family protein n=1 Tax=Methanoregula sp. TaxID=2052170 RepID=UPI0025D781A0|nr:DJ-1/PfpI family protein [Methanoregula sp.]MCK9630830.1 DJ-1/PfpI family protein [Methanoregula sp.]